MSYGSGSQLGCHLHFTRMPQAIAHYSSVSQHAKDLKKLFMNVQFCDFCM